MLDKAFFGRVKRFKFEGSLKRAAKMGQLLVRDGRQVRLLSSRLSGKSLESLKWLLG